MKNRTLWLCLICLWVSYFIGAFSNVKPASTTSLRSSNPEILANWAALETAIDQDHDFTTGSTQTGKHEVLTMQEEASAGASSTNELHVQAIDGGSGQPELAVTSEDGNELQITKDGDLNSSAGLTVDGASTLTGTVTMSGAATVGTTLGVTGVATLGDGSLLATSAAPTTDAMIANKKFIDDQIGNESDGHSTPTTTGYQFFDINGVSTKVYTKYIIGTLASGSPKTVAHGLDDADDILSISVHVAHDNNASLFSGFGARDTADGDNAIRFSYDDTNVNIHLGSNRDGGNTYRIEIDYFP